MRTRRRSRPFDRWGWCNSRQTGPVRTGSRRRGTSRSTPRRALRGSCPHHDGVLIVGHDGDGLDPRSSAGQVFARRRTSRNPSWPPYPPSARWSPVKRVDNALRHGYGRTGRSAEPPRTGLADYTKKPQACRPAVSPGVGGPSSPVSTDTRVGIWHDDTARYRAAASLGSAGYLVLLRHRITDPRVARNQRSGVFRMGEARGPVLFGSGQLVNHVGAGEPFELE